MIRSLILGVCIGAFGVIAGWSFWLTIGVCLICGIIYASYDEVDSGGTDEG